MHVEKTNAYRILVGKAKVMGYFEDVSVEGNNIKINLNEIRGEGGDWIYVALSRDK